MSWLSPSCPLHLVEGPRALGWHGLEFLLQQMGQELRKAVDGLPPACQTNNWYSWSWAAFLKSGPPLDFDQAVRKQFPDPSSKRCELPRLQRRFLTRCFSSGCGIPSTSRVIVMHHLRRETTDKDGLQVIVHHHQDKCLYIDKFTLSIVLNQGQLEC